MQSNTANLKWRTLSWLMNAPGRTSNGIEVGYRYGFDSGEMLDYVYENRPSGKFLVGTVIDWLYLNSIGWRAIRARKELLKNILISEIAAARAPAIGGGKPLVLLDVAAGPGRYLLEVCEQLKSSGKQIDGELQVICRDLDRQNLEIGSARAEALGLTNVRYEWGNAIDPNSLATVQPAPDVVVVSGLYELFTDAQPIHQSMQGIYNILKPGGKLICTTQVTHPQLDLIANVLTNREGKPWVMVCRSLKDAEELARSAGFRVQRSSMEPLGLFGITVCEKEATVSLGHTE